jgi:hypothetical protein
MRKLREIIFISYILVGYIIGVLKYYNVVEHKDWYNAFILQYTLGRASGPTFIAYAIIVAIIIFSCRLFNKYVASRYERE